MPTSKRARVLMILGWYYPDSVGGTENYVRLLTKDLKLLGWDSVILAPSADENERTYEYEGIEVYRYPVSLNPSLLETRGQTCPEYFEYFESKVKEFNPDIVHIHSYTRACSVYHAQFAKEEGFPVVVTVHVPDFLCARGTLMKWGKQVCSGEMIEEECTACVSQMLGLPKSLSNSLNYVPEFIADQASNVENKIGTALSMKRTISTRINNSRMIFDLSEHIVSVCDWLGEMLIKNKVNPNKITISKHGVVTDTSGTNSNNFEKNALRIGYIGRFKFVKGVHVLIEAVKKLPKSVKAELLIYGRADTEEEIFYLEHLETISKNDSRIKFDGAVNDENRADVLKSLDILAIPSIWLETGPYVLLEAFSLGIPVIGSNLGGISELVTDKVNGLLVKADDVQQWADAIEYLSENQQLIQKFKTAIPAVKSSREVAKDMVGVYESVLA